jgi:hypothetical protein
MMNTATAFERPPGLRVGIHHQTDFQNQLFAALELHDSNLGHLLNATEPYSRDVSMAYSEVEWDERLNVSGIFPGDRFRWGLMELGGREEIPTGDRPVAWTGIWSGLPDTCAFPFGKEMPAFEAGHDYMQAYAAKNSLTSCACFAIAVRVADDSSEAGATLELVRRAFRATVLPRDVVPVQTLRSLKRIKELPDNWDGDGASRIEEETVLRAAGLIREAFQAAPNKLKPPSVAPAFGGMIVAEWSGPDGRELILDIPPAGEVPGFLLVEPSVDGDEIETDALLVPPWSMRHLIARLNGE